MADQRTIGGTYWMTQGAQRFEIIGDLTIKPAGEKREFKVTAARRGYTTVEAMPFTAKCKFANFADADPVGLFNANSIFDLTFVENRPNGARHIFTGCSIVGEPEKNLQNGEIDGLEFATDNYIAS